MSKKTKPRVKKSFSLGEIAVHIRGTTQSEQEIIKNFKLGYYEAEGLTTRLNAEGVGRCDKCECWRDFSYMEQNVCLDCDDPG